MGTIIKLGLILAIITALIGGMHWYNQGLIEQGKDEVRAEWAIKNAEAAAESDKDIARLEKEKAALAKKYYKERAVRVAAQKKLNQEREDAIHSSTVAAAVCFDERMRDNWNRDSGHAADSANR